MFEKVEVPSKFWELLVQ